jgi:hypothetical protein
MHRLRLVALFALILAAPIQHAAAQSGDLTCDDFTSQDAAQIVFEFDEDEFADLDEDGDGEACPDLPARDEANDDGDDGGEPADLDTIPLGTERADAEDALGDPADDTDEDEWETGVLYDGTGEISEIGIVYIDDLAAHIILTFEEDIPDSATVLDIASDYLPDDTDLETSGTDLDDNATLYEGTSDDLADLFPEDDTYADLGGDPGDLRVILVPGDDGTAVVDIAIGAGDEYVDAIDVGTDDGSDDSTDDGSDDGTDDGTDADAAAYLETVRGDLDTIQEQIDTFDTLFVSATGTLSDEDIDTLVDILVEWSTATTLSDAVTAPDGYEDIQTTFEELTGTLEAISLEIANGESADFDAVLEDFASAQSLATDLDDLLTAEGA